MTALMFHADNCAGIVCSKCFKYCTPGSFSAHAQSCTDGQHPSSYKINTWLDSPSLWAIQMRQYGPQREFNNFRNKDKIWSAMRNAALAFVVPPRMIIGKTMKLKALCVTKGFTTICTFNALSKHLKTVHMNAKYSTHEVHIPDATVDSTAITLLPKK